MGHHDDQVDALSYAWRALANGGHMEKWQAIEQATWSGVVSHIATAAGTPLFFLRCTRCGHAGVKLNPADLPCDAECWRPCWRPKRRDHPPAPERPRMRLLDQGLAMAAFLLGGMGAVTAVDQYAV